MFPKKVPKLKKENVVQNAVNSQASGKVIPSAKSGPGQKRSDFGSYDWTPVKLDKSYIVAPNVPGKANSAPGSLAGRSPTPSVTFETGNADTRPTVEITGKLDPDQTLIDQVREMQKSAVKMAADQFPHDAEAAVKFAVRRRRQ